GAGAVKHFFGAYMPYLTLQIMCVIASLAVPAVIAADERLETHRTGPSAGGQVERLSDEARKVAEQLEQDLASDSEARAMLDHILKGSRLGPGEGWFALARSQTRFGWPRVAEVYDTDGDGGVTLQEFEGSRADFERLDRDGDNRLTPEDLDWTADSLTATPGTMIFFRADRDANGKVTAEE